MLLELLEYATRLLRNNMTTIILATTTATATATATNNITTNFNNISIPTGATPVVTTTLTSLPTTLRDMLPERPAATTPALETFNSTLKTLFNKTLANVAQANLSDYTTPYTLLPPLNNVTGISTGIGIGTEGSPLDSGSATTVMSSVLPTLPVTRYTMEATTSLPAQTVATFMAAGHKNRATIIVYPTVSPESIVIPIVSCIFGFPILALLVICCLRRRAKLARERDRRRNYDMQDHAVSLVRFSPIHRLNYRPSRAISLRPERSLSQGFTSLELDTVVEERCSDVEQTQTEILNAESPMETTSSYKMSFSS
ncbi:PREDICTED: location of vulva defective 1-like [Rhagoletis zephyria]|uniref:location of vulva defective 1-like n=1 Tax=Rhagoletis zephyria TaxID=28612 RepID=UPI0008113631|nr:PREDICTED: location of vulva defective 1-like [Rhagoletis zephyria]XP_017476582.1 PREDICTED: location of vulva defective 1-like [Rhagoletis zephyria]XP_017476583.1 PREDICTED: location of vulva defective 1-like [Rhagoletis zephyria]XP_017476584.1 PREDICTED: location of vulva defective 1-like [Rhagoletis zephyria]XP_017476585.1 PREDICTED: location of vulva defective 1-like [Rhagoletis zephyria]XP_017476586.1 PREDICTED: location of vulva defective 1-like [Rhagoletis zephyria]